MSRSVFWNTLSLSNQILTSLKELFAALEGSSSADTQSRGAASAVEVARELLSGLGGDDNDLTETQRTILQLKVTLIERDLMHLKASSIS